jgi:hypothetical protein
MWQPSYTVVTHRTRRIPSTSNQPFRIANSDTAHSRGEIATETDKIAEVILADGSVEYAVLAAVMII